MKIFDQRRVLIFGILLRILCCLFIASEGVAGESTLFRDLSDIVGDYQGEVREQDSEGFINRLVVPRIKLSLSISGDQLVLRSSSSELQGRGCNSEIGNIRELIRYPLDHSPLLKAEFDFRTKGCSHDHKDLPAKKLYDAILAVLSRDDNGNLTLETLLIRTGQSSKINIHGYFTKAESAPLSAQVNVVPEIPLRTKDHLFFRP